MRFITLSVLLWAVLVLPACGGGGGGIGDAIGQALVQIIPPQDANVRGTVSNRSSVTTDDPQYVGDTGSGYAFRATMGFDIAEPIGGRGIERATLRIDVDRLRGDIDSLGTLWVEAVELGDTLDGTDYGRSAYASMPLPGLTIEQGVVDIDVTDLLIEMYATGRRDFDLRLRFSVPYTSNGSQDGVLFTTLGVIVDWR